MDTTALGLRIWITAKTRINSEARLLRRNAYVSILLPYYSVAIIALMNAHKYFKLDSTETLDWLTDFLSLIVLVFSVVVTSFDYKSRAEHMKDCYLELRVLGDQLTVENLATTNAKYVQLLKQCENHVESDYFRVLASRKVEGHIFTKLQKIRYVSAWIIEVVIVASLSVFPIILCIGYVRASR